MAAPTLEYLQAQEMIRNRLVQYCRAVDHHDLDLLRDVYWPDAIDDHGFFKGNGHEFAEFNVTNSPLAFSIIRHSVSNIHAVIEGDEARVESYVLAYHRVRNEAETVERLLGPSYAAKAKSCEDGHDYLVGGQYFDRFQRRGGEWRILERLATSDWDIVQPSSATRREGAFATADAAA
jgi:hypothetical protein